MAKERKHYDDLGAKASSQREKSDIEIEHRADGKPASLDVNGLLVAKGRVCFYANPDRGEFQPDDPVRLSAPIPYGTLALIGTSMRLTVINVHQCPESPWNWNFVIPSMTSKDVRRLTRIVNDRRRRDPG